MEGSALKWQEESNETGGFVAHDFAVGVPTKPALWGDRYV